MPQQTLTERVIKVEGRVDAVENRIDSFQDYCKETQIRFTKSSEDTKKRIDGFLNHQVTELKKAIADTQKMKRSPWGPKEWVMIAVAFITSATSIIITLIQMLG